MTFVWDPMYAINLVLCVIILVLGIWGYKKSGNKTELFVGVAFGLFGVSHLATLFGYKAMLQNFLIVIRTVAYLLVVYALYKVAFKK